MITGAGEIVWFHLVILLSLFPTVFTVHSYLLKTTAGFFSASFLLLLWLEKRSTRFRPPTRDIAKISLGFNQNPFINAAGLR